MAEEPGFFARARDSIGNFITGNKSRKEATVENDLREAQAVDAEFHVMEVQALERREEAERRRRDALRSNAMAHIEAEQARADNMTQTLLAQFTPAKEAYKKREDQLDKVYQEEITKELNRAAETLEKQKTGDKKEKEEREKNRHNLLDSMHQDKKRVEESVQANISALKNENIKYQELSHRERKEFREEKSVKFEEKQTKISEEMKKTAEIKLEKEKNKFDHDYRMAGFEKVSELTKNNVSVALQQDTTENNFITAANNMISDGQEFSKSVESLAGPVARLKEGSKNSAMKREIAVCKMVIAKINDKMMKFQSACEDVIKQHESRHEQVQDLQGHARDLQKRVLIISSSLTAFSASLNDDPIDNACELFNKLQTESRDLYNTINQFPVVCPTNHALTYMGETIKKLAIGSGNDPLKFAAAQNNSSGSLEERDEKEQEGFIENCDFES